MITKSIFVGIDPNQIQFDYICVWIFLNFKYLYEAGNGDIDTHPYIRCMSN